MELAPERSVVGGVGKDLCFPARRRLRGDLATGSLQFDIARDGRKGDTKEFRDLPPWDAAFYGVEHFEPEVLRVSVHASSVAGLQLLCKLL